MANITPVKTWTTNETLTSSDLNAEFTQVYNNAVGLSQAQTITGVKTIDDDTKFQFGAAPDYWFEYDSGSTQFEFSATDIDGGGTDGIVFLVNDGTNDVQFQGGITLLDSENITLGTGSDATIDYDGTDMVVDPRVVGSGVMRVLNEAEVRGDAGAAGILTLSTAETTVVDGDKLGQIDFQAPLEADGTDSILVGASIWAEADDTFSATLNDTDLVFAVAESETAAERMRLSYDGTAASLALTGATVMTLSDGSITDSSGAISFGNENLSTTGTLDSGNLGVTGTITGSGVLSIDDTTDSTSDTTGSIHTDGGLGVAKSAFITGVVTVDATDNTDLRLGQNLHVAQTANYGGAVLSTWSTTAAHAPIFDFNRSKSATQGTHTAVANNDTLGYIPFRGSDGSSFRTAASIQVAVDGTVSGGGAADMPGRITFHTSSDGTASDTEALRIDSSQNVGIGVTAFGTSATNVLGITADGTVPSSSPAGMIQIFADDSSAGATNATLAIRTEETVTSEVLACDSTLNIWVNGVEYHLLMRAV